MYNPIHRTTVFSLRIPDAGSRLPHAFHHDSLITQLVSLASLVIHKDLKITVSCIQIPSKHPPLWLGCKWASTPRSKVVP